MTAVPLLEARDVSLRYGSVAALTGVSLRLHEGEVHCLLGDNGAGKSSLIKILSGVERPSAGQLVFEGQPVVFGGPRDALDRGIATVFQDLGMIPLMSVARNFFLGREPVRRWGPLRLFDSALAAGITTSELARLGIRLRSPDQPVGTLSGGERQCIAIARAVHFGARLLILDEPTSALGVSQTGMVLDCIAELRARRLAILFITHNSRHALEAGDRFTILNRGRTLACRQRGELGSDELQELMAGRALPDQEVPAADPA